MPKPSFHITVEKQISLVKESERSTSMLPPGSPPRPGLQWKPQTHRWIRPETESPEPKKEVDVSISSLEQAYRLARSSNPDDRVKSIPQIDKKGLLMLATDQDLKVALAVVSDEKNVARLTDLEIHDLILSGVLPYQIFSSLVHHIPYDRLRFFESIHMAKSIIAGRYIENNDIPNMRRFTESDDDIRAKLAANAPDEILFEMLETEKDEIILRKILKRTGVDTPEKAKTSKSQYARAWAAKNLSFEQLEDMIDDPSKVVLDVVKNRLSVINTIGKETLTHFHNNFSLPEKLSPRMINAIRIISTDELDVAYKTKPIFQELYHGTPFEGLHEASVEDWEESSSGYFGLALKDSIRRQFGGSIVFHDDPFSEDADTETRSKKIRQTWKEINKDRFDKYVRTHYQLTQRILQESFPEQDHFTLYRGTTEDEVSTANKGMVKINQNSISSWSTKYSVAKKFANESKGIVLKIHVPRSRIWSTFASHSYEGNEREILLVGKKGQLGEILQ